MIGASAPAAQALDHLGAVHVGQPEVEHDEVRRAAPAAASSAASPSATAVDLVVARAEVDRERLAQAAARPRR